MFRRATLFAALIINLAPRAASAQRADSIGRALAVGARIRVTAAPPLTNIIGVMVSRSADTLVLKQEASGSLISIPAAQITRFDMSGGAHGHKLRNAAYGLLGGAAIGAVIGWLTYEQPPGCRPNCNDLGSGIPAMFGALGGGGAGLVLGTFLGTRKTERWSTLPATGTGVVRLDVSFALARTGVLRVP